MPTRFAKISDKVKTQWIYEADGPKDTWDWGTRIVKPNGNVRIKGDCEDYCFRVIWRMEGGKTEAIQAIKDGQYVLWWCTTLGDGGEVNHLIVENKRTEQFVEVIFGRATRKPNERLGTIRLVEPVLLETVLGKLGEIPLDDIIYADK